MQFKVHRLAVVCALGLALLVAPGAVASDPYTVRVSITSDGEERDGGRLPAITGDGRYVAFYGGIELRPDDVQVGLRPTAQVYVHDRDCDNANCDGDGVFDEAGGIKTTLITVITLDPGGKFLGNNEGGNDQIPPENSIDISDDGRFVVFASHADNLVDPPPTYFNNVLHVFLHDRDCSGDGIYDEPGDTLTELLDTDTYVSGNLDAFNISISGDGEWIVFDTTSDTLPDANGIPPCYLMHRDPRWRIAITYSGESCADGAGVDPEISADGSYVTLVSMSCCLTSPSLCDPDWPPPDGSSIAQSAFRYERSSGDWLLATVDQYGQPYYDEGNTKDPRISADGRYIVFTSDNETIVAGDTNGKQDVFLRDMLTSVSERVSLKTGSAQVE